MGVEAGTERAQGGRGMTPLPRNPGSYVGWEQSSYPWELGSLPHRNRGSYPGRNWRSPITSTFNAQRNVHPTPTTYRSCGKHRTLAAKELLVGGAEPYPVALARRFGKRRPERGTRTPPASRRKCRGVAPRRLRGGRGADEGARSRRRSGAGVVALARAGGRRGGATPPPVPPTPSPSGRR